VNTFFTGQDASDIAVSDTIIKRPTLLSAAQNGEKGDNQTALAISGMESTALDSLNGTSLKDTYQSMINGLAVKVDGAKTNAEATKILRDTLETQREAISGVSLDEEAINLIREQRAFQGAARIIAAVDEMMKTILQM
jgi:flagellar hook-associated protein 1 FlgK